jgi:hypothetical protein
VGVITEHNGKDQHEEGLMHCWVQTLLTFLILFVPPGLHAASRRENEESTQMQSSAAQLQDDLAKVSSFLSSRDLDSLEAVVNVESAKWQRRDRQSFLIYMYKVCSGVSSYDFGDQSKQSLLLGRYAISVLTSGDLPLKEQVKFVEFLALDPIVVDEATWGPLRLRKAELFLEVRRRLIASTDSTFDFGDRPYLNVPAPPNSGVPSGSSPQSIKDPKLRAEYESAVARNSTKARQYNDQYWIKTNAPSFYKEVERYLVDAYARPPSSLSELQQLLLKYVSDESVRARVLQEIQKSDQR